MRLYTLQNEDHYNSSNKYLTCDMSKARKDPDFDEMFRFPYRWLIDQMNSRGIETKAPIWFFVEKPDMRHRWTVPGERLVRLTCDVPDELCLISDLYHWGGHILNGWPCVASEWEDDWFDKKAREQGLKRAWKVYDARGYLRDKVIGTWGRIFPDRWGELVEEDYVGEAGRDLQVTAPYLNINWVKKMERFTSR